MPKLTNPGAIPSGLHEDLKAVLCTIGPQVLGEKFPQDVDPENLNNAQLAQVFELVTREFWRQQIQARKANEAAEKARVAVLQTSEEDPFGEE